MRLVTRYRVSLIILVFCIIGYAEATPTKTNEKIDIDHVLFGHEPSIATVQVLALDYAGLNPGVINSMHRRIRRSAWLPEISLSVRKSEDNRSRDVVSLELVDATGDTSLAETRTSEVQVEATAKFRLSELVFSPEEVDVARENRYAARLRLVLLTRVANVYFSRRRFILELYAAGLPNGAEKTMRQFKIDQLTAELDGLTGGGFSRQLNGVSP